MKLTSLDFNQFQSKEVELLSMLNGWRSIVKDYHQANYLTLTDANLYFHWNKAIDRVINFIGNNAEPDSKNYYMNASFRFFLAKNNEVEGIALGHLVAYRYRAEELFGVSGLCYEILDILISPDNLFPRCFPSEEKSPDKHIEKNLLIGVIDFIKTLNVTHPIMMIPENNDQTTQQFLKNNLFTSGGGSMGCSYTLMPSKFDVVKTIHEERIGLQQVSVFDNYDHSTRGLGK